MPEFRTDSFKVLSHFLSLVSSTTVAYKIKAARDLVALEQSYHEPGGVYTTRARDIEQVVGSMKLSDILPLFVLVN